MIIWPINFCKEVKPKFLLKPIFIKSSKKPSNPKPTKTNVNNQNSTFKISSVLNKLDNTLIIRAGVNRKNVKKTVDLSNTQMNLMKKGKFTDSDINIAKEYFQTALDSVVESEASMIENYFMMDLMGLDDIDVRRRKMNEVSKSDIIKVAKKIKMDTVFCIEGVNKWLK